MNCGLLPHPAWRVCVHVRHGAKPVCHASLLDWLQKNRDGRALYVVDASQVSAFGDAWPESAGAAPAMISVADGSTMVEVLAKVHPAEPGRDLIYIDAGCAVAADWDVLLARVAAGQPGAGVASPLSAASPLFSPFTVDKPDWMEVDHVQRWLTHLARGQVFEVPAILSFCACWRASALRTLLSTGLRCDDLAAAEETLAAASVRFVAGDWIYVDAPPGADAVAPRPREALQSFLTYHPLLRMRHGFGEAGAWGEASLPPPTPMLKPVQLHVAHSWGGGLGRWVEDYCEGDGLRWNLVLRSIGTWGAFGQRIALYRSHQMDRPLRDWLLDMPIGSIAIRHLQYRRILDEIVRDFDIDALIISSLIGHSLDVLDLGLPTVIVGHDYTPFCAALSIRFDDAVCSSCDARRLRECFERNPLNHFFRDAGAPYWQAMREHYQQRLRQAHIRLAAPSASVARHLHELMPAIADLPVSVIAHGAAMPLMPSWSPDPVGRLRLVVLGSMAPQKGADLFAAALPELRQFADLHLVGCGDEGGRFADLGADRILRRYQREELPAIIADLAPHAGLLLSVVPETFSYTLSELQALGVPPVATRLGGFADRIDHERTGFLFEPDATALLALLHALDADRTRLSKVRSVLASMPVRSREDMVADYHQLLPMAGRGPISGVPAGVPGLPAAQCAAADGERAGALHIDRQVPLRTVTRDFLGYLAEKVDATPRLGAFSRRVFRMALHAALRLLR